MTFDMKDLLCHPKCVCVSCSEAPSAGSVCEAQGGQVAATNQPQAWSPVWGGALAETCLLAGYLGQGSGTSSMGIRVSALPPQQLIISAITWVSKLPQDQASARMALH